MTDSVSSLSAQWQSWMWPCCPTEPGTLPSDTALKAAWLDLDTYRVRALWTTLSAEERKRADRFRFERDRSRFVAARGMLRMLLAQSLGAEPAAIEFKYSSYGKPSLAGDWATAGLQFNLSHSQNLALFALAAQNPVGVDVEEIHPVPNLAELVDLVFSTAEAGELRRLPDEEKEKTFFRIWTRKEACLKATGVGMTGMPDAKEALGWPCDIQSIQALPQSPIGSCFRIYELMPVAGFCGALAMVDQ